MGIDMPTTCDCSIGAGDFEKPEVFRQEMRKAAKEHLCCECGKPILKGEEHEYASGLWDGYWDDFRTCIQCKFLRDTYCSHGFMYGGLFEQIAECVEGKVG